MNGRGIGKLPKYHSPPPQFHFFLTLFNDLPAMNNDWGILFFGTMHGFFHFLNQLEQGWCVTRGLLVWPRCIPVVLQFSCFFTILQDNEEENREQEN